MNHLGFSIKEANGTLVLILLLSIVIFAPWLLNAFNEDDPAVFKSDQADILLWKAEFEVVEAKNNLDGTHINRKFSTFNPNKTSRKQWVEMGVKPKIADRISKYQAAGGQFNTPQDIFKIYGIDSATVIALLPYVVIPNKKKDEPYYATKKPTRSGPPEVDNNAKEVKKSINDANADDLKKIYGIGDKLSARIVKYRNALGGFHHIKQLEEVYFFQDSLLPKIESKFYFDSLQLKKVNLNVDSLQTIKSHPYLSYNQARAIVNYRNVHGPYEQIEDLKVIKILPDSTFDKLKPYISLKE